jgi:membrane-associated PAP2 superfamily phosphatase
MGNLKISNKIRKIDLLIIGDLILILLALCLSHFSKIDVAIQNHLFDFETKTWIVDRNEIIAKNIFYRLPKIFFGLVIIFCLFASFYSKNRRKFFFIFLGMALIPLVVGNIKKFTNVYCPCQLEIYDGSYPYVKIFQSYPQDFHPEKRGQCFPAGHAVTGFSLLILFFLLEKKSHKLLGLFGGILAGWTLGFYQMAKGVHFFSDTLVSMLVCFLLAAVIARIYEVGLAKRSN